jgi:hypothetical protein
MKKIYILILFFCSYFFAASAQFSAGLTNRVLVKTDLTYWALGAAANAELEFKIKDQVTLSLGVYVASKRYHQTYTLSEYPSSQVLFTDPVVTLPDQGIINSRYVSLGIRKYLNRIRKAPFGVYYGITIAGGMADLGGTYDGYIFDPNAQVGAYQAPKAPGPSVNYSYFNVPLIKVIAGMGYQGIITGHIYYDASIDFEYNRFLVNSPDDSKKISGLVRNFGPILNMGTGPGGMGLTGLLKVGYLIF